DQHRRAFGQADQFGARGAGQAQVADDQVEAGNAEAFLGLLHGTGLAHLVLVALEQTAQGGADDGFVFDDENVGHGTGFSSTAQNGSLVGVTWRGRVTRMRVPRWRCGSAGLSMAMWP